MGSFWATMMMVIMYLNLESRVCMNTSNLFKKELKIKTHVDRVCSVWLLNLNWDALIFLNFRLYFLKSDLYFFWVYFLICCKLVQNLVIRWCHLHCLVSKLSTRLCTCIATLPRNALLALSACITCITCILLAYLAYYLHNLHNLYITCITCILLAELAYYLHNLQNLHITCLTCYYWHNLLLLA